VKVCDRCLLTKQDTEFRIKTSGPRAGFVFPRCKQCEREVELDETADYLRVRGYTVVRPAVVPPEPGAVAGNEVIR
jgi:exosome complex RNA-binding protein Csl4